MFILAILALFIGGALALFAWRAPMLKQGGLFAPISREGALVLNNLLLTTTCATVLIGTLYPLALEQLTGEKITVGAPFFNMTCGALLLTACLVAPFGFSLAWKRGDLLGVAQRLDPRVVAGACLQSSRARGSRRAGARADRRRASPVFVILGSLSEIVARAGGAAAPGVVLKRARGLPLSFWGGALAHIGVGVTLLGLVAAGFGAETIATLHEGRRPNGSGPIRSRLDWSASATGPNYREAATSMTVRSGDAVVADIEPARRQFAAAADDDDPGRHRDAVLRSGLYLDRRPDARRRRARRASTGSRW